MQPPRVQVQCSRRMRLPAVTLYTVDPFGTRLLGNATQNHRAAVSFPRPLDTRAVDVVDGMAVLNGTSILEPLRSGTYALELTHAALGTARPEVVVVPGTPERLVLLVQPHPEIRPGQALQTPPVLVLHDAASNPVTVPDASARVLAALVPAEAGAVLPAAYSRGGNFTVGEVRFRARHGVAYALRFRLDGAPAMPGVVSAPIRAPACARDAFYVPGATACAPCPRGATCGGRAVQDIALAPNFWRCDLSSPTVVPCPAALPNGTCGGGAGVSCGPGHRGLLCTLCAEGRSGLACEECNQSLHVPWLVAMGLVSALLLLGTAALAFRTHEGPDAALVVVTWKKVLNFLQTLFCIQPMFQAFAAVSGTFTALGDVMAVMVPENALRCVARGVTFHGRFMFYICVPALGLAIAGAAYAYDRSAGCRPSARRLSVPERRRCGAACRRAATAAA